MAKTIVIRGVVYTDTPALAMKQPNTDERATFYETSDSTVTAATLQSGVTAYGPAGKITGTQVPVIISQDPTTKVVSID